MKLAGFFKNIKKEWLIVACLVGILLVIINIPTKKTDTATRTLTKNAEEKESLSTGSNIEKQLENMLTNVKGVGSVRVMVTYCDLGKDIQYIEEGDNFSLRTEKNNYPEIQGVLIIAKGADDIKVVSDITDAVSALLGITVNKIRVLKMEA